VAELIYLRLTLRLHWSSRANGPEPDFHAHPSADAAALS
jgi:hypothetical protein